MTEKLSFREKFGYSLGDMAANFVFQALLALQLDFYTHTFGLTAAQAGTHDTRGRARRRVPQPCHGRHRRPHQHAGGANSGHGCCGRLLPFGIICVLTFTTPNISPGAKIVYAWTTYILLRVIYTVNNVPYASLNAVMTSDPDERNSISTYRQIAANSAGFIVASLAIPMVRFFGHGNDARGYQFTMGLLLGPERHLLHRRILLHQRTHPARSAAEDLAQPGPCRPFQEPSVDRAVPGHFVLLHRHRHSRQCDAALFSIIPGNVDLFSWFNGFGLAALLAGVACSTLVAKRVGKRLSFIASMMLAGLFAAALLFIPPHATVTIIAFEVLRQFSFGLSGPMIWSMMGDVADYGEWKTGRRASGTVTAAVVFALWAGLALGGAVAGWLFDLYGFVSKADVQSAHAQSGILLTASVYAGSPSWLRRSACSSIPFRAS